MTENSAPPVSRAVVAQGLADDVVALNPLQYDLVMIQWVDSSRIGEGWIDLDDILDPDPHLCVSVGFVVRENERGKVLIPTVADVQNDTNRHTHGGIMIPICSIVSERQLLRGQSMASS